MISALRVFFRSIGDTWFNLVGYSVCNVVVAVGAILLPFLIGLGMDAIGIHPLATIVVGILLFVIVGAPLLIGLLHVTAESLVYNERPEVTLMLRHARSDASRAWMLLGLEVLGIAIVLTVVGFYLSVNATWAVPLSMVSIVIGWIWFGTIFLAGPMMVRSEKGALTALRNGFVAFSRYPFFTTTLLIMALLVGLMSILISPLIVLITLSFLSVLLNRATVWILQKEGLIPKSEYPEDESPEL